jgi:hypothetical protein
VVIDPLGRFWAGGEHENMNNQAGAAKAIAELEKLRQAGGPTCSLCSIHHLNKSGGVTGSQQIVDYHRASFEAELIEQADRRLVEVKLAKANESALVGEAWHYEYLEQGALWPSSKRDSIEDEHELCNRLLPAGAEMTKVELVSGLVASGADKREAKKCADRIAAAPENYGIAVAQKGRAILFRRVF